MSKQRRPARRRGTGVSNRIPLQGWKRWGYPLIAIVAVPLAAVLLLEVILRICGFGQPTGFFVPETVDGRQYHATNAQYGWRFFPRTIAREPFQDRVTTEKPANTVRVVVLGESAAMGDPEPSFGLSRMLRAVLQAKLPSSKVEVINAAMTGINSHSVRCIAQDCARERPDYFVIYMGNNEVVGPYGPGTVFAPLTTYLALTRFGIEAHTWKTVQLLDDMKFRLTRNRQPKNWGGLEMFLANQLPLSDSRLPVMYRNFGSNLEDICASARRAGARIVLCTVASNLSGCAPFASAHRAGLNAQETEQWDTAYRNSIEIEQKKGPEEALTEYAKAAAIDDSYAELEYRIGKAHLTLKRPVQAMAHLTRARDLDTLRFRTDSALNGITSSTARRVDAFVDTEQEFARAASNGVPGFDLFLDHVHMNFRGNHLLAGCVAREILKFARGADKNTSGSESLPSSEQCAATLAYTPANDYEITEEMVMRYSKAPMTNQFDNTDQVARLQRRMNDLKARLTMQELSRMAEVYRSAIKAAPEDWVLHENYATVLERSGDHLERAEQYRVVATRFPGDRHRQVKFAEALAKAGKFDEAEKVCAALGVDAAEDYLVHYTWAVIAAGRGDMDKASASYNRALHLRPDLPQLKGDISSLFEQGVGKEKSIEYYQKLVAGDPKSKDGHMSLGLLYRKNGMIEEAASEFGEVANIDPADARARYYLGSSLFGLGLIPAAIDNYRKAVSLDPKLWMAWNELGTALAAGKKPDEALTCFKQALQLQPGRVELRVNCALAMAQIGQSDQALKEFESLIKGDPQNGTIRFKLGRLYDDQHKTAEAIANYREALRLAPDYAEAQNNLAWLLATAKDTSLRKPEEAVTMAKRACEITGSRNFSTFDTLAAAYAAAGQFAQAVETAQKAQTMAISSREMLLAEGISGRLELYKANKACPDEKR